MNKHIFSLCAVIGLTVNVEAQPSFHAETNIIAQSSFKDQPQLNNEDYKFEEVIPRGLKSQPSSAQVNCEIRNNTSRFLDFRWIDFEGNLELVREGQTWGHKSTGPGNNFAGGTLVGHPIVISDPLNGKTFGYIVFLRSGSQKITISEDNGRLVLSH